MISKNFFKSSLIYSVVGALPYASGFILLPVFIKYLSQEQVGLNALYFTIIYFVQVFSTFGLDSYIGISYFDYKKAIFYKGFNNPIWRLRAITGYFFSLFHRDVEGISKLLGKNTYRK